MSKLTANRSVAETAVSAKVATRSPAGVEPDGATSKPRPESSVAEKKDSSPASQEMVTS